MIKSKVWRIPIISIFTGFIITVISLLSTYYLAKGTQEWTLAMSNKIQWIDIVVSLVLFISTGVLCLKDMDNRNIIKSATIVTIYYVLILGLEQVLMANGLYPFILSFLFCPVRVYSSIVDILAKFADMSIWTSVILSMLAPYLYIAFGKKNS